MSKHENAVMIMHRPPCYAKKLRRWTRRQPRRWGRNFCIVSPRCILFLSRRCDDAHNVPSAPGHLSTPITDFGKGHAVIVVVVLLSSSRSYRLQRAKPAAPQMPSWPRRMETCSNLPLFFRMVALRRAESNRAARFSVDFIVATFSLRFSGI